ncbi:type I polyketide synthase [Streptomyces acidiscabies]|uniref:Type I polyketide synthase n=6 Tax=Streptomyces acidiscabies TaxID=42234 RepID=A0AAP6BET6_9ACTN|nr:type I polyketide synthase [Streptomyces acidiscabies]MBP5942040.1 type I polyketide synthase [Streptomyces sp. LBUM 1476]MBZ3913516.1 type I polyketide synthase [Streptomyces acidiscabies]MDX2963353.1 type I polyketide synthase [Streptomyces acidiscabies]MDX3023087.1 type I polyketide synthase [Streptomyces acidiscabies]MDX3792769.1 type I polyketide synthase [Streptomyces acidiscabies]
MTGTSQEQGDEPIAVVGLSCRFPGDADSPDAFWDLLVQGRDGIGDGAERWAPYAGTGPEHAAVVRETPTRGGFLADIAGFDAEFFGIAPREAELMDPQQRLLLELAWEALEHAGLPPLGLGGTDCGVFVGVGSDDYGRRLLEDLARIEPWTGIGAALCATANRISHSLDLRGPSLAVDTACSASLVGVHLACRSLLAGESDVALAAGVNLMVAPGLSVTLARAGATSPDGHSKPFDASADGYGRGEGAGVLVLKRLSDAERAGDRVLAVIRGSGVSQDGRTAGIMAPNGEAQADLLRRTYAQCGIAPQSVDYVEAHGTGTVAGDPLEAGALAAVFGAGRPTDSPCLIGSVKGNIGHLEAGSGIAGMIKTILALVHEEIPPSVHFSAPNPRIPWAEARLRVTRERTPWRRGERPRRAGVSSFGYGGTIAHVVLEEAPAASHREETPAASQDALPRLFPLSGRSEAAVREDAARLADWLDGPGSDVALASVAQYLGTRRSHLERRVAVVAADRAELAGGLRRFAAGDAAPGLVEGTVTDEGLDDVVWVFSGTGAQWPGMGRELLATDAVFAEVIDRIGPVFAEEFGATARELIEDGDVSRVDVAQTMIYAVQMGLVAVWRSLGVQPAAVIGHSMGEIAAAATAGVLSLEDGARLVCRRSVLLRRVAGAGGMLMIGLPADEAEARLGGTDGVVPAVLASPTTTVVAGAVAEIEALARDLSSDPSLLVRRVDSDVAFHSPQMEPLLKELAEAAADLTVHAPRIPVYSTALADPRDTALRDGAYWAANLRSPVRLSGAVSAAAEDGFRTFLEVSAHPVVRHSVQETLDTVGADRHCLAASLRRDTGERQHLLLNAGLLYCHGVPLDWPSAPDARPLSLPVRSWRRQRFWRDLPVHRADRGRHDPASRTLLGPRTTLAGTTPLDLWRTRVDLESRPYPGSHTIHGAEIVPAAVVLQTFLDAAGVSGLSDVSFDLPLALSTAQDVDVIAQDGVLRLLSRTADPDGDERSSLTHAVASVSGDAPPPLQPAVDGPGTALPHDQITTHLASVGVPSMAFPWRVERLERVPDGLRADIVASDEPTSWAPLFDAALSMAAVAFPGPAALRVVAGVGRVWTTAEPPPRARLEAYVDGGDTVNVRITAADDRTVAVLSGVRYAGGDTEARSAPPGDLLFRTDWNPLPLDTPRPHRPLVLVGADGELTAALRATADGLGVPCLAAESPDGLDGLRGQVPGPVDVLLLPLPDRPAGESEAAERAVREAWQLASVARLLGAWPPGTARLWSLTRGVREADRLESVAQAARWGLGRVVGGEHPELWGGTVDLAPRPTGDDLAAVLRVVAANPGEDVVAVREGGAWANRLVRSVNAEGAPLRCRQDGTYLVTGGLGSLGGEIARWLVERGARRLVLAGRSALPPRSEWDAVTDEVQARRVATVRRLEALGATVRVLSLDLSDAEAAAAALTPDALGMPPVRGVVHAAGVLQDQLVDGLDADALAAVMRPKAGGALTLHRLFPPGSLDFLVHFSSCGQYLGLTGQAAYASANAFLDAMAGYDHTLGAVGSMSLAWTSWRGMGMAANAAVDAELQAHGVGDITAPEAFAAWDLAGRTGAASLAVLRTVPLPGGGRRTGLLRDLAKEAPAREAAVGALPSEELSEEELRALLHEQTVSVIVSEMKLERAQLDPDRSLLKSGLDSVMAIVIRRRLERLLERKLPANLVWHQQTVTAIVNYLVTSARS